MAPIPHTNANVNLGYLCKVETASLLHWKPRLYFLLIFLGGVFQLCACWALYHIFIIHTPGYTNNVRNWLTYILGSTTFPWQAPLATVVWIRTVQIRSWTFPSSMVSPLPLTETFRDSWRCYSVFCSSHTASGLYLTLQSVLVLGSVLSSVTHMPA